MCKSYFRNFISLCAISQIVNGWKALLVKDAWLNQEALHIESPLFKRHFACQSDGRQLSKALPKVGLLWNATLTACLTACLYTIGVQGTMQ